MTLQTVKEALLTVTDKVFHYQAWEQPDKYIVWAEDAESGAIYANNKKQIQTIQGTIDYFTKEESDQNVRAIQSVLNDKEITWSLNSVQHEQESGYIHYEWVFELEGL